MFYMLSKAFWFFCAPSHLMMWTSVAAAIMFGLKCDRAGRWLAVISALLFISFAYFPAGVWIMQPLEDRYQPPAWPAHVDGILVLGGGLNTDILKNRGEIGVPAAEPRVVTAFELARRYPNARVVFSGGGAAENGGPETVAAKFIFAQMGLDPDRLLLEDQSGNTWENLLYSQRLAKPHPGEVWVLATSAYHMPRAMAIAARLGWKMIPWPTDYTTAGHNHYVASEFPQNLQRADTAAHEWLGLLTYELTGRASPTH